MTHEPEDGEEFPETIEVPIDGVLDLHSFAPRDVQVVVEAYLDACREREILAVRLIHGKGTGFQKRAVEAVLRRHPAVRTFGPAGHGAGGWGATLVELLPPDGEG
jgi:DNA-nicking Smr family endonuclease